MEDERNPWEYPQSHARTVASHVVTACVSAALASIATTLWLRRETPPVDQPAPALEVHEIQEPVVLTPDPPEDVLTAQEDDPPAPETQPVTPPAPSRPVPGQAWEIPDLGMALSWIPPGEAPLGSTAEERAWVTSDEGRGTREFCANEGQSPRPYIVSRGFWMAQTEVTVAQWRSFVTDTEYRTDAEKMGKAFCWSVAGEWSWVDGKNWRDPNWQGTQIADNHPVSCISWNDGMAFCTWLNDRGGKSPEDYEFRLPGEAEWEYACRGGRGNVKFWWGDRLADGQGRANLCSADMIGFRDHRWNERVWWRDGYAWGAPVDSFGPLGRNGFGLADMLGNVWEWCYDHYTPDATKTEIHIGDEPDGPRVLRGGAFNVMAASTRCAKRAHNRASHALACYGFRVCLAPKVTH